MDENVKFPTNDPNYDPLRAKKFNILFWNFENGLIFKEFCFI